MHISPVFSSNEFQNILYCQFELLLMAPALYLIELAWVHIDAGEDITGDHDSSDSKITHGDSDKIVKTFLAAHLACEV